MKLSTLTRINSLILFGIALILAITLIVGIKQLNKPIDGLALISDYRTDLNQTIVTKLRQYLSTGDLQYLTQSQQALSDLQAKISNDPMIHSPELLSHIADFNDFLINDSQSAGKLAGNEQGLLIQNERETRDTLSQLLDYANQADDSSRAQSYITLSQNILFLLQDRSLQRQLTLAAGSTDLTPIDEINQQIVSLVNQLQTLQPLGVYQQQEVDDFAAMLGGDDVETEQIEIGSEIINALSSLTHRYMAEVNNTLSVISLIANNRTEIQSRLAAIVADFESIETGFSKQFASTVEHGSQIMIGIIVIIIIFSLMIDQVQRGIANRIRNFVPYLTTYATGDFTNSVSIKAKTNEVMALVDAANALREHLITLLNDVKHSSSQVNQVGDQVSLSSQQVVAQMTHQLNQTIAISSAVEQMAMSIRDVAQHASDAAQTANSVENNAKSSSELMTSANANVAKMAEDVKATSLEITTLGEYANNITKVVDVISGIAEQTNLLALNAAIEAARAGENGRGFAVVADEVRQLSLRTTESTAEIRDMIQTIQKQATACTSSMAQQVSTVEQTVLVNQQANQSVKAIVTDIAKIRSVSSHIAENTEQQALATDEVSQLVHAVRYSSEESQTAAQGTQAMSEQLAELNKRLHQALAHFKIEA